MSTLVAEADRVLKTGLQSGSRKVLIADDDPVSRLVLESFLADWNHETVVATDGAQAWKVLQEEDSPSLAILDWMMPHMDGPQICRELRRRLNREYVYIILLTAKAQKQDLIDGLEAGADDYLAKPFDKSELKARLRAGARIIELQRQLLVAQEALREQATHDSLTGAFNRPAILEILQRELARREREHSSLCLAIADIDHFKAVNDIHGHQVGDVVLREVISRFRSETRRYDSIGRYGGEEFLIVSPNCDSCTGLAMTERLRARVADVPFQTDAGMISLTVSLGVAICEDAFDVGSLIHLADGALYRAKHAGRNRVEVTSGGAVIYPRVDQALSGALVT